ncbi:PAC2 family protein [Leucobacter sp. 1207-22]|uniref:PAC2 family protein n=1 Tax=Leucobacter sp. 1207-22 TaxID=2604456 RepID=UPI0040633132
MSESVISEDNAQLRADVPRGLPMVVVLSGVSDAGSVVSQLGEYFSENSSPREVIRFDTDVLLDYRARRPVITFNKDHFEDYQPETLTLSIASDALGEPFLLLSGFEPDFRWERWVDTMLFLVDEFEVSTTAWVHALPMPVPHTRDLRATISGSREDLIEEHSIWQPTSRIAATAVHLLEYRLFGMGESVAGITLLIPHYLAGNEYPAGLVGALDYLMAATGKLFSTEAPRELAQNFRARVDEQIGENDESLSMVHSLEERYDQFVRDAATGGGSIELDGEEVTGDDIDGLPTADQLASELEQFLAGQISDSDDDDQDGWDIGSNPPESPNGGGTPGDVQ